MPPKRAQHAWTPQDEANLIRWHSQGVSSNEMVRRFGGRHTSGSIRTHLWRRNVAQRAVAPSPLGTVSTAATTAATAATTATAMLSAMPTTIAAVSGASTAPQPLVPAPAPSQQQQDGAQELAQIQQAGIPPVQGHALQHQAQQQQQGPIPQAQPSQTTAAVAPRRRAPRFTEREDALLISLRDAGVGYPEIARRHFPNRTERQLADRMVLARRKQRTRAFTGSSSASASAAADDDGNTGGRSGASQRTDNDSDNDVIAPFAAPAPGSGSRRRLPLPHHPLRPSAAPSAQRRPAATPAQTLPPRQPRSSRAQTARRQQRATQRRREEEEEEDLAGDARRQEGQSAMPAIQYGWQFDMLVGGLVEGEAASSADAAGRAAPAHGAVAPASGPAAAVAATSFEQQLSLASDGFSIYPSEAFDFSLPPPVTPYSFLVGPEAATSLPLPFPYPFPPTQDPEDWATYGVAEVSTAGTADDVDSDMGLSDEENYIPIDPRLLAIDQQRALGWDSG